MLKGLCSGWFSNPHGFAGRSLLGRQAVRKLGTAPGGAATIVTRLTPNASDGDVLIASVAVTPGNYALRLNQDGTFLYNAHGDNSRQSMAIDGFIVSAPGLYGEGTLTVNDAPPQPASGPGTTFWGNATYSLGQPVSKQLVAVDPNGDTVTFSISAGTLPTGLTMTSGGLVTGTVTVLGTFGFTTRLTDPYGAFTDVPDQITVGSSLPDFTKQSLASATVAATALGLTVAHNTTPSALPINTIISQTPSAGSPIVTGATITFTVSDGSLSTGNPNLFPQNILGLTWSGTRTATFKTGVQSGLTGKTIAFGFTQYPIIEWDLNYELLNQAAAQDDLKKIEGIFNQVEGQTGTFLYQDPSFYSVTAQAIPATDSTNKQFQLVAENANVGGPGALEIVQAVDTSVTPILYDNGTPISTSAYTIGPTGLVNFTSAITAGHTVTWTGQFFYNCVFAMDDLNPSQFMQQFWSLQSLKFRSYIF